MKNKIFEISLGELTIAQKGYKPLYLKNNSFEESVPYIDVDSLENEIYSQFTHKELANISTEKDVLVIWDGGRSGYPFRGKYGAIGSTLMCLKPVCISQEYLYYFLKSKFAYVNGNAANTGVSHVNSELFFDLKIPYTSIENQSKAIDELKSKFHVYSLIHAQQKEIIKQQLIETKINFDYDTDNIEDLIIDFRQAVLDKVFTNRISNGYSFNERQEFKLGEVGEIIAGQSVSASQVNSDNKGLPYITGPEQLRDNNFDKWTEYGVKRNTKDAVFIIVKGTSVGTIFRGIKNVYIGRDLFAFVPDKKILNIDYIFHLLEYLTKELIDQSKGVIPGLTKSAIENTNITLPSLEEQEKIVSKIKELFTISDELYNGYKESTQNIIQLEKSVLQDFFESKLDEKEENEDLISIVKNEILSNKNAQLLNFEQIKKENSKIKQQIIKKNKSETKLSIPDQVQLNNGYMSAKDIWENSVHEGDIDNFYEEARRLWQSDVIDWHLEKVNEITPESVITLKSK